MKFKLGDSVIVAGKFPIFTRRSDNFGFDLDTLGAIIVDSEAIGQGLIIDNFKDGTYTVKFEIGEAVLQEEDLRNLSKLSLALK